jgi:hypothetical protein
MTPILVVIFLVRVAEGDNAEASDCNVYASRGVGLLNSVDREREREREREWLSVVLHVPPARTRSAVVLSHSRIHTVHL